VGDHWFVAEVFASGRPVLVDVTARPDLGASMRSVYAALMLEMGITSVIVAPLRARGRVIGILHLERRREQPFEEGDLELAQDIADRVALAIENARLFLEATDAVRVRDEFLSIAGHELRTPLTALLLQVHSILRSAREDHAQERVVHRAEQATRSGARLARLIDELLDVSRVSSGRVVLELVDADLGELVKESVARLADELERAECTVSLVIEDDVRGRWDPARLEQVITNLMTNAIKYGRGAPIHVGVEKTAEGGRLSVRDHGVGVAKVDQGRIFDRFARAASARHFGGLGLGLWIVRQIVEAHGGTVLVESAPQEGARFIVELPGVPQCRLSSTPPP